MDYVEAKYLFNHNRATIEQERELDKKINHLFDLAIPSKPIYYKLRNNEYWKCPNCSCFVSTIFRKENGNLDYYTTNCNCSVCGQKLDWYVFTPQEEEKLKNIL